ncbi:MAG: LPS-assembly protein LptD [Burkholderiales bacterium]
MNPVWAGTNLPPLKVDPRLLGLPGLEPEAPGTPPESPRQTQAAPIPSAPAAPKVLVEPAPLKPVPPPAVAEPHPTPAQSAPPAASTPSPAAAPRGAPIVPPAPAAAMPESPTPPPEQDGTALQLQPALSLARHDTQTNEKTPVFISADRMQGQQDNYIQADEDVELRKLGLRVNADTLRYDQAHDVLDAAGHVRMQADAGVMKGPDLHLNLADKTGYMNTPAYAIAAEHAHGDAQKLTFLGENDYAMRDARYSTCAVGDEAWWLRASEMEINRTTNTGTGYNAWIQFQGVPILYTPYISFPLHRQRKSGLLTPSFGTTGNSGAEFSLPYYWNIAPNYDATITPRFMSKRGLQLGGEFRYLQPHYAGELQAESLPHDAITQTARSAYRLTHNQNFGYGFTGALNVQKVSDNNYFRDLSSLVAVTSQTTLPRQGSLNYANGPWSAGVAIQRFQTLQDPLNPIIPPYERVPQITAAYNKLDVFGLADVRAATEYVAFDSATSVRGSRFTLNPSFSVPLIRAYGYITPKLGVSYTRYQLDRSTTTLPDTTRTLPIFSLDSGLTFEREAALFGRALTQTLEPRVYYLYVPYKDQSQIPNFDSGEADFNFAQIFSENRFTGGDRISDANQVTFALTSRFLETATGQERLRAAVAQRYYFRAPKVTLTSNPPTDKTSDFLASIGGQISPAWSMDTAWQYNPNDSLTKKFNAGVRYNPATGKVANMTYRFYRNVLHQFDVSAQWPIAANWQAVGRWNYSIQDRKPLETLAGVEYQAGCWAVRVVAHRFQTGTQKATDAIFVQLELSGLAGLGTNPLNILKQNIGGFTQSTPQAADINLDEF